MNEKTVHIVSFDNPFPPNYGGVIDVFYKIKALHQLGVKIYLHCYYKERDSVSEELKAITEKVFLYPKKRRFLDLFSPIPLSVISRFETQLITNLQSIEAPIFVEGLQSSMFCNMNVFKNRKLFLRLHNIESNFYAGMSRNETSIFKKILFYFESKKYIRYEKRLGHFEQIFTLSCFETKQLKKVYQKVDYIPVFHGNKINIPTQKFGKYALYHGDLRLADNKKAAKFFISIFQELSDYTLIIASNVGRSFVEKYSKKVNNIHFVEVINYEQLISVINEAHINLAISFQQSGTKLKLFNSLFNGRFCIVNENVVDDENILELCEKAESRSDFVNKINALRETPFLNYEARKLRLEQYMSDIENAKKLVDEIFE
jgi:hypothetical protein